MTQSSKGTFVTLMLTTVLGGLFLFFLNVVSFGAFSYVLASVFGIAFVGFAHYAVWGYSLSKDLSQERADFLRQQQRELDVQAPLDPYGIQSRRNFPQPPDDRIQR